VNVLLVCVCYTYICSTYFVCWYLNWLFFRFRVKCNRRHELTLPIRNDTSGSRRPQRLHLLTSHAGVMDWCSVGSSYPCVAFDTLSGLLYASIVQAYSISAHTISSIDGWRLNRKNEAIDQCMLLLQPNAQSALIRAVWCNETDISLFSIFIVVPDRKDRRTAQYLRRKLRSTVFSRNVIW